MDSDPSSPLIIIVLSLVASALFSGMEMAFVASSRLQTELNAQQSVRGKIIAFLSDHPQLFIATMLVGNNMALVICGMESGEYLSNQLFGVPGWQSSPQPMLVLSTQTLITTAMVLVLAEFLPKSLFHASPNKWLHTLAYPLIVLFAVLAIPAWVIMTLSKALLRPFVAGQINVDVEHLGAHDLDHFIKGVSGRMGPEQELEHELQILQNALELPDIQARESMVPRNEVVGVEASIGLADLQKAFAETGLSKLVVYKGDIDHIVGYVHAKDLFRRPEGLSEILHPTFVVPEPMAGDVLLKQFLSRRRHLAVVVDEFGGTAGILTMEDIVEELLGEIEDEHDQVDDLSETQLDSGAWRVPARKEIRALNDGHDWRLPESDAYDTLGGLVLDELGDIPAPGTVLELETVRLVIQEVADNRIEWVEVWGTQ